jgi:hypothetical protein
VKHRGPEVLRSHPSAALASLASPTPVAPAKSREMKRCSPLTSFRLLCRPARCPLRWKWLIGDGCDYREEVVAVKSHKRMQLNCSWAVGPSPKHETDVMTTPLQIADTECWRIAGLRDAQAFFRAVPQLLAEATHLCLEGAPAPDIVALIATHTEQGEYRAPAGTLWSWPQRNQRFTLTASPALFAQLSEAAAQHAEPEICSHLHFYRDAEPLAHWFDAFDAPLFVSKVIPLGRVEQFCLAAGGALTDPAA